jgi:uncharacterized phage protein (TIGR02218 family)
VPFTRTTQVLASDGAMSLDIAATGCAQGWFAHGVLVRSNGERLRLRDHLAGAEQDRLSLWSVPGSAFAPGEGVTLIAGCDKSHVTCRERFANVVNIRGFPHMPGNEMVLAYAHADDVVMNGGSLFR